ncbi:MAG TPA: PH domain-containing protein, partial [Actinomycetota bacterium]|nr:PH domain-containing protein [Actinomycetota bacterium]
MRSEPVEPGGPGGPGPGGPGWPRRLHPLSPVFLSVREGRRLWPLGLFLLAQRRLWLIGVAVAVVVAVAVLSWLRRTYVLEVGALRVEQGVLARRRRVVPFDRIQQVDLVRKPLHRLLGVATLRVETAGGPRASEVDLDVIALAEAERLRAALLRARAVTAGLPGAVDGPVPGGAGTPSGPEASPRPERTLVRLTLGQVALAGVTGSRAAAVLALLSPVFQVVDQVPRWLVDRLGPEVLAPSSPLAVAALVPVAALVWLGLAAGSSIVTDAGFVLARSGDNLVVRRGLLERREAVVPLGRIQVVRIEESLLRRSLGYAAVRIQSAGSAGRSDHQASRLAVPLLPAVRVNQLLDELL